MHTFKEHHGPSPEWWQQGTQHSPTAEGSASKESHHADLGGDIPCSRHTPGGSFSFSVVDTVTLRGDDLDGGFYSCHLFFFCSIAFERLSFLFEGWIFECFMRLHWMNRRSVLLLFFLLDFREIWFTLVLSHSFIHSTIYSIAWRVEEHIVRFTREKRQAFVFLYLCFNREELKISLKCVFDINFILAD